MEKSVVTCMCFVPTAKCRGSFTTAGDEEVEAAHEEVLGAAAAAQGSVSSSSRVPREAAAAGTEEDDDEFKLNNYDDSGDEAGMQFFSILKTDGELAKVKDPNMKGHADSDSEEEDEYEVAEEDFVFVAASCEEDDCLLEMYIYADEDATMFVHHEVQLLAYPLCLEWLARTEADNFVAVGSIDHTINIWDLAIIDTVKPVTTLGQTKLSKKGKRRKGRGPEAHDGPVLSVHSSVFNRSVLASGSADQTVKVWDISENTCVHTYTHHNDKVQCTQWHPTEQAVMLTAAFDKHLGLLDVRESAIWSRHKPFECLASTDKGHVVCYDVRRVSKPAADMPPRLWTLCAHNTACTSVVDTATPDMLITSSLDGTAKVWSVSSGGPALIHTKALNAGQLFTSQGCPDAPALAIFGGRCPVIWDLTSETTISSSFQFGRPASAST
eukprot:NODE_4076_length_1939_cov_8.951435.p1 GENE.NODE_4076_length_1939_cov_8.951435~~NODE_4076_length_1939_cov_8.951435.p1  ORF type:complete len:439 (-),score=140.27 NODE_4076_length_1939_cov_8.951435:457-1773(-)